MREVGAPLPGLVVSYARRESECVASGERLTVVEAMETETNVTAPISGRIAKIVLSPGTRVEAGDLLLEIESEPGQPSCRIPRDPSRLDIFGNRGIKV